MCLEGRVGLVGFLWDGMSEEHGHGVFESIISVVIFAYI